MPSPVVLGVLGVLGGSGCTPTILPVLCWPRKRAWAGRGACSPRETSRTGGQRGETCVGTAGEAGGDTHGTGTGREPLTGTLRGVSRLKPLPLSEPRASTGSALPPCLGWGGMGRGGPPLGVTSPPCPSYRAAMGGQVVRGGGAGPELRERNACRVLEGEEGSRGGWGLTGWPGAAGRMTPLNGVALVKPVSSLAPMVVLCRTSAGWEIGWGGLALLPRSSHSLGHPPAFWGCAGQRASGTPKPSRAWSCPPQNRT